LFAALNITTCVKAHCAWSRYKTEVNNYLLLKLNIMNWNLNLRLGNN